MDENDLKQQIDTLIRSYPDFPSKGVLFRRVNLIICLSLIKDKLSPRVSIILFNDILKDVLPLFSKPTLVHSLCCYVANRYKNKIDLVAGLEARGFLFGPIIALELGIPFVPVRKQGKLPGPIISASYQKEYGKDVFEVQQGALSAGQRVLIVDDLLATGGSLHAAEQLVKQTGAKVYANFVVIELGDLNGRKVLGSEVDAFLTY
uniref:Adenine phosphoribosyltransferase n=1 Tax=Meloidogyne javanica TaxID=6303 RepID=A0A915M803_MELJA